MGVPAYVTGGIGPGSTIPLYLTRGLFDASAVSAAVSGTASGGLTEAQVVAGGETIIITLTNDTWVASGATFDAQRQNIIDGLDSAGVEALGWNAEVRDKEVVGAVVRTSDTVVTITLTAAAAYDITSDETITVTIPATALVTSSGDVPATPTFSVTADIPAVTTPQTSAGGGSRVYPYPRDRTPTKTDRTVKIESKPDLTVVKSDPPPMEAEMGALNDAPVGQNRIETPLGESLKGLANFPELDPGLTAEGLRALIAGLVAAEVTNAVEAESKRQDALKIMAVLESELEEDQPLPPEIEEMLLLLLLV